MKNNHRFNSVAIALLLSTGLLIASTTWHCGLTFYQFNFDQGDPDSGALCSVEYDFETNQAKCSGVCDWLEMFNVTKCEFDFENYSAVQCQYCAENGGVNVPYQVDTTAGVPCTPTSTDDPELLAGCGCYFDVSFSVTTFTDDVERYQGIDCELCRSGS